MVAARAEIDGRFKWRLEDMFASNEVWEKTFADIKAAVPALAQYSGQLDNAERLKTALDAISNVSLQVERLYVFAHMRRDEDNANPLYQGMTDRAAQLLVELEAATSYVTPELLKLGDKLAEFAQLSELGVYRHMLLDTLRSKPHVLDEPREKLLAMAGEVLFAPKTIFNMLDYADIRFPNVQTPDGEQPLTHGNFILFMENKDQAVRKDAFLKFYSTYKSFENTLAATYASSVKGDVFASRVREHANSLEAALFGDRIPVSVYEGLTGVVHSRLGALGRYLELRKKALKLDALNMYDLYTPMIGEVDMPFSYEEAAQLVKAGLAPLGKDYAKLLERAFSEGWIDVYENTGKTSGAYCWGAYGTHPFVLLNYQPNINSVFTIAHELGHAMHSHYSDTTQPFPTAQYTIFVAEVASTVNEILLMRHLLSLEKDKLRRMYIINYFLEQFRTTLYRQVMFAEFEKRVHELCEQGEPLTSERLCNEYLGLNETYYGKNVHVNPEIAMEWARISHFYSAFYVYKYATGFSAANAIAASILKTGDASAYVRFLKSGGSDYPLELLKLAGVDLSTSAPVEDALDIFESTLCELEKLMEEEA